MPLQASEPAHGTSPDQPTMTPTDGAATTPKRLPRGVVLGKDGKPCRTCTSFASWAALTKSQTSSYSTTPTAAVHIDQATLPPGCPPDVDELGRNTWSLLHSLTATYPSTPSPAFQQKTKNFISLFSNLYPCSHCADDFRDWMNEPGNAPRLSNRDEFGRWMCQAHNAVNEKLGKDLFDCNKWDERWRTGPPDGRCG